MAPSSTRARSGRALLIASILWAGLGCNDGPAELELEQVISGTIDGIPFTVTGGTVYQAGADGPLRADATGGQILFDDGPLGLGMSDAGLVHLRTYFAISDGGSIHIAGFGQPGSEFNTGVTVTLERVPTVGFVYELRFAGGVVADSTLSPQPPLPGGEHWVVTELYADSVPGFPSGQAGAALWPIDDLSPAASEDMLGCASEPSMSSTPLTGSAVGYVLEAAWLLEVEVVDLIVGPCT
jgi:hypothetical protein